MNDRRVFLRKVGVLGLFASGASAVQGASEHLTNKTENNVPVKELNSNTENIVFQSTYGEIDRSKQHFIYGSDERYKPETLKKVEVALKVGPDGKLYVKENDIWRKI